MRSIKRTAVALKVIGFILIFLAVILSIYALAGNKQWGEAAERMQRVGLNTGILNRIRFDHDYFLSLSIAANENIRPDSAEIEHMIGCFDGFSEDERRLSGERLAESAKEKISFLVQEFDPGSFLERMKVREDLTERKRTAALIAALDELAASKASGPKNKPFLKKGAQASCGPQTEAFYGSMQTEHADITGDYNQFLEAITGMIHEDIDAGKPFTSVDAWLQGSFDMDRYSAAVRSLQSNAKEAAEENLLNTLAEKLSNRKNDEEVRWDSFIHAAYESYLKQTGDTDCGYDIFALAFTDLLENSDFTGEVSEIASAVRKKMEEDKENSFTGWLPILGNEIAREANARSRISVVNIFWRMTSDLIWFWVLGILMILLSAVMGKILNSCLVSRMSRKEYRIELEENELLRVSHLKQYFRSGSYINKAVDDVSFSIRKGEVFGLVGESGCGKTTTGRTIINLYDPTEGDVYFQGLRISSSQNGLPILIRQLRQEAGEKIRELKADLTEQIKREPDQKAALTAAYRDKVRGIRKELAEHVENAQKRALESAAEKNRCIQKYRERRKAELTSAFEQDRQTLSGKELEERKHRYEVEMKVAGKDNIMTRMQMVFQDPIASINPRMTVRQIIAEGLIIRGVRDQKYINEKVYEMLELVGLVREHADRYPHEFSGGQRQRIGIARAIVMEPDLIIADEPISALDVSIQAQVINLMNDLRKKMGLTIMFIAHNLSVVKYFSDRIGVMYYGRMVELATSEELFAHPLHPYTKSLLSAIPYPDPHHEKNRKRITYDPHTSHDYSVQTPVLREIVPGHFILCNDAEFEKYQKELGSC